MVTALALSAAGFRAIVLEEQPEFNLEYPALGQALEAMEPLCFSAESLEYLTSRDPPSKPPALRTPPSQPPALRPLSTTRPSTERGGFEGPNHLPFTKNKLFLDC